MDELMQKHLIALFSECESSFLANCSAWKTIKLNQTYFYLLPKEYWSEIIFKIVLVSF